MSNINIVYGPNKYILDNFLKRTIKDLPSSFKVEKYNLTTKDSKFKDFIEPFTSFNLFAPKRLFVVEVNVEDILNLLEKCVGKCDEGKLLTLYCPDLYVKKSKKGYKSKKKSSNNDSLVEDILDLFENPNNYSTEDKSRILKDTKKLSVEDVLSILERTSGINLTAAHHLYDYDDAYDFCYKLIKELNLNFKSERDIEDTIDHLISCSQLTCNDKGELIYITCDTEPEDILYEQNLILNNLNTIAVYSSTLDEIDFEEIEGLLFSIVNKTQSKKFMRDLFKCSSPREATKMLDRELSILNRNEIRTFISYFRNILDHYLKMIYDEYYVQALVSPVRQGNLKICNPEQAYDDVCDILSDYTCTSETYVNKLKLCLYNHFS